MGESKDEKAKRIPGPVPVPADALPGTRNINTIAREILRLADKLAVKEKRVKGMQKTGESKENPTLWIRRDIGDLVKQHMAYSEMSGYYGSSALDALAEKLEGRYGANTLRDHANYASQKRDDVENQVKQGLSWRKAVREAKSSIIANRKRGKNTDPSDLDLGD